MPRYEEAVYGGGRGSYETAVYTGGGAGPPSGGGDGGGGGQAGGFELPEWLRKRLRGGVSPYEMPLALQMLLWQGAMQGQTDPFMLQQASQSMFTPQQFLAQNPEMAHQMRLKARTWGEDVNAYTANSREYQLWLRQKSAQVRPGIEGGPADERTSGFLPDKEAYMAELRGTLSEYAAQLGVSREAFEANLAQRGISGAGQATEARYRDVTAPVMRAGAQATRQSFLDYLTAYQRGSMAAEGFRQQDIERLTGSELQVGQMAQTTQAQNLNRLLQGYLGQGQLDLGFKGLALQSRIANKEFAFRAYENKLRVWMFEEEMRQRDEEMESEFWSNFFGDIFEAVGEAAKGF